jgi:hypothetical protein
MFVRLANSFLFSSLNSIRTTNIALVHNVLRLGKSGQTHSAKIKHPTSLPSPSHYYVLGGLSALNLI